MNHLTGPLDSMDYVKRGYPIDSGQVKGVNKNVIGTHLKRSGMRWNRPAAGRMAAIGAQLIAIHPSPASTTSTTPPTNPPDKKGRTPSRV